MKIAGTLAVIAVIALLVSPSFAIECPPFPEQTNRDWEAGVSAEVAKIGTLKGPGANAKVKTITNNLLAKYPDAGKYYIEQMMTAMYCSTIRDDKSLTDAQRRKLVEDYTNRVRNALGVQSKSV